MNNNIGYSDTPSQVDFLSMDTKYKGLADFICKCNTPMTISLNGDWGTGKTSAMKIIQKKLIDEYDKPGDEKSIKSQIIEFNTWEFSILGESDNLLINLLININESLMELEEQYGDKSDRSEKDALKSNNKLLYCLQNVGKGALSAGYNILDEVTNNAVSGFFKSFENNQKLDEINEAILENTNKIKSLKRIQDRIKSSIKAIVEGIENEDKKPPRLFIFIDDLDRLDPSVALELIEGMQNYVFCENCVFILAVDQKVIERGLQNKYGKDCDKEMSEHFFDKVIQLPFKLPVETYDIANYVEKLMEHNNMDNDGNTAEKFAELIKIYGIKNPRTIKRSFNLLRMYQCIDNANGKNSETKIENRDLKQYAVSLLLMDKKTESIHLMFSQVIDSSVDYENNDDELHNVEKDFRSLAEKYSEQSEGDEEQNGRDALIINEILKIFYGDNYNDNDGHSRHDKETNELISVLTLTKPQDINYDNKPYARIIYDLISRVKNSNLVHFIEDGSDMSLNDITVPALSDRNSNGIIRFAAFGSAGKICREFKITWDPTVDESDVSKYKLWVTVWSPAIDKDNPFGGNTEIASAFCVKSNAGAQENRNKYPYNTGEGAKSTYENCNRITIYIRKNGDLKHLMRFMTNIGIIQDQ